MNSKKILLCIVYLSLLTSSADAEFMGPTYAPVDRLIANTTAYLKENPKSHQAFYTLARIHYLAFVNKSNIVGTTKVDTPPQIAPNWLLGYSPYDARWKHARKMVLKELGYASVEEVPQKKMSVFWEAIYKKEAQLKEQKWKPKGLDNQQLLDHASAAVSNFKKAIELDPQNSLYLLGLASLYQQYHRFRKSTGIAEEPPELKKITLDEAREKFYMAYSLSIKWDLKLEERPMRGLESLVGYEAASAFLKLSESDASISKEEAKNISEVKKALTRLEGLKTGAITPIIFTLQKHSSLSDLLEPESKVFFDLDGDGTVEERHWVKSTTGFLVWDPGRKGVISSGRQLFGSVSWWGCSILMVISH